MVLPPSFSRTMGEIEAVEAEKMGWLDLPRGTSYPTFPYLFWQYEISHYIQEKQQLTGILAGCPSIYCQYRRKRQQRCKSFAAELMASKFNFDKRLRVTGHEYRKMDYGAALRCGCSCENRFVSKRWHPSFNVCDRKLTPSLPCFVET